MPLIRHENATYGDLILLPGVEETAEIATHIKPFEFYKHVARSKRSWTYVSKYVIFFHQVIPINCMNPTSSVESGCYSQLTHRA